MTKRFITPFAESGIKAPVSDVPAGTDVNYETGYTPEYALDPVSDPNARFVEITNENQILNDITGNIKHWQENTFPEFITAAKNGGVAWEYSYGDIIDFEGVKYRSLYNSNTDEPTTSKWELFIPEVPPFKNVSDMKSAAWLSILPEGTRIEWQGYYDQSDGGNNWGVLRFGAHTADGGSVFSIDANTYIEANLKGAGINVRKFGARGDGVNDDRYAIQTALNVVDDIVIKDGAFMVDATYRDPSWASNLRGIKVPSGKTITWVNAALKVIPTSSTHYNCLHVHMDSDVTFNNITLVGDREEHMGTAGEHGFGLYLRGATGIKINGGSISNMWGDGLVIGEYIGEGTCKNIRMNDFTCANNRRQGLTVASVNGLYATRCYFKDTNGTIPEAGVDIEPDSDFQTLENIYFTECVAEGNSGQGFFFYGVHFFKSDGTSSISITHDKCVSRNNGGGYTVTRGIYPASGNITYKDCTSDKDELSSYRMSYWNAKSAKVIVKDCTSIDPRTDLDASCRHLSIFSPTTDYTSGNFTVVNPVFIETGEYPSPISDFLIVADGGIEGVVVDSIYGEPTMSISNINREAIMGSSINDKILKVQSNQIMYNAVNNAGVHTVPGIAFYNGLTPIPASTELTEVDTGIKIGSNSAKYVMVSTKRVGFNFSYTGMFSVLKDANGTGNDIIGKIYEYAANTTVTDVNISISATDTIVLQFGTVTSEMAHPTVTIIGA